MPRVFVHATDAKVISRHAVPKYRLGQHGMGRHIEWALYTFSLSSCTQLRLDLRHTTHADDLLIHKLIQFTGGTIWHGRTVRNGMGKPCLIVPHSKLAACKFVIYHPRLACNWRFEQKSVCFWGYSCTIPIAFFIQQMKSHIKPRGS